MTKKTFLGVMVVALVAALAAGALYASNMGFKLNYTLRQGDGGVTSLSGTNSLALPDNRQTGLNDALGLLQDIGFQSVANIQKFIESSDGLQVYTGRKNGGTSFALAVTEGNFIKMNTTVNYIVVGSDNPTQGANLQQGDGGATSLSGTNFYAYNYHQTAATALDLLNDIGFLSVANVQKFIQSSDGLQIYTGRKNGGTSFALTPGEAYFVKMNTTVSSYVPSHY